MTLETPIFVYNGHVRYLPYIKPTGKGHVRGYALLGGSSHESFRWVSSPQFFEWTLPPLIPLKSPGLIHPLTIRGMNHQVVDL